MTHWSVDGRSIYYKAHGDHGKTSFWTSDADGRSLRMLVRFPNPERQASRADCPVSRTHVYFTIEDRPSDVYVAELIWK